MYRAGHEILSEEEAETQNCQSKFKLIKPVEMKSFGSICLVSRTMLKVMSVAVYNHYKRLMQTKSKDDDVTIEKSNIVMVSETGTGKTYIARTL